jgi:GNAT superfamily N-acetyltransferase
MNMDIKLARISKAQIPFFEEMDPFYILERTTLPEYFAYAAAIPGSGRDEDIPVGLLVGSLSEDTLYVNWLYVAAGFRGEGVGETLLVQAIRTAREAGIGNVTACFDSRSERDEICFQEEGYFKERDFTEWIPLADEWESCVELILKRCSENANTRMKPEAFRDLPEEDQMDIIRECKDTPEGLRFPPYSTDNIDPDISFYSEYKGNGVAVIFAGMENAVFPLFLSDTNSKEKDALLIAAANAIKKKYGPDTLVIMRKDEDTISTFPEWMFAEKNRIDRWGLSYNPTSDIFI